MLSLLGFLMIATFMFLIMSKRLSALVALILIPVLFALVGGFAPELGTMMMDGVKNIAPTGVMLIFGILYFGIMIDAGLFDPLVNTTLKIVKGDPLKIVIGSAILALLVSLDGDGSTTYMIVIAAMLPLYKKLNMNPLILTAVTMLAGGIMNITPWGGPTARAMSALHLDSAELFNLMIPGLLIGGGIYIDFWTDPLPDWSEWIPFPLFAVVIWILFSGKLLLFLEDADVLFLRQQKTWMKQIMLRGVLVSFLTNIGKECLLSVIVLPLMVRNFEFDFTFWITFFIFIALLSCVSELAERMIAVNYSGWKGKLLSLLPAVLAIVLIMITIRSHAFLLSVVGIPLTLLLMILLLWLIGKRTRMTGTFMRDVHEDNKTKMVLTEKLLSQATEKPTESTAIYGSSASVSSYSGGSYII